MADNPTEITIFQGDTFPFEVTCNDSNGDPVNLTGYTALFQMRLNYADREVRVGVSLTIGDGLGILTPANGKIQGSISAARSAALVAINSDGSTGVTYRFDLQVTAPNGDVNTVWWGTAVIQPEVAR